MFKNTLIYVCFNKKIIKNNKSADDNSNIKVSEVFNRLFLPILDCSRLHKCYMTQICVKLIEHKTRHSRLYSFKPTLVVKIC